MNKLSKLENFKIWAKVNLDEIVFFMGMALVFLAIQGFAPLDANTSLKAVILGNLSILIVSIYQENSKMFLLTLVMGFAQLTNVMSS
tara:strand:+ start:551 stop:811 length:261 start_codon:yes stop_codon:yes gene_type:complete